MKLTRYIKLEVEVPDDFIFSKGSIDEFNKFITMVVYHLNSAVKRLFVNRTIKITEE